MVKDLSEPGGTVSNNFLPPEGRHEDSASVGNPSSPEHAATPEHAASANSESAPKKTNRARFFSLLAGGLVLLLVLLGGGVWLFNTSERNVPARQVGAFLTALVQGRAMEAMQLSGNVLTDQDKTLINDEIYQNAQNKISGFTIGQTQIAGDKATVTVEISQGNESYPEDFSLSLDGQDLFVDKWRLDPVLLPTATVQLSAPASLGLTVAGIEVKPELVSATGTQPELLKKLTLNLLPGDYPVAAARQDANMTTNQSTAEVRGFSSAKPHNAIVAATLNDQGKASITTAVNQYLDSCAAQQTPVLNGCPFSGKADDPLLSQYKVSNARWSIVTRPTLSIAEWAPAVGWLVLSTAPGTVSFAADLSNGVSTGSASIDAMTFSLGGQVLSFKDGVAQFSRPSPGLQS